MDWVKSPFRQRMVAALVVLLGGALLTPLIMQLPLLGHDWQVCFEARDSILQPAESRHPIGACYDQYPPWTYWILRPWTILPWRVGLSFQIGMLLMTVAITTGLGAHRYGEAVVLALLTPPIFWLMWLGQSDGLAMWGLMFLPLGILWVLTKPNIAMWALFARWQWVALAAGVGLFSLLIWGWWPDSLIATRMYCPEHPSAMGWASMGWPVLLLGLILFPFSGPDPLRLMASGVLLTPFFMPYHFVFLLPALGRVRGWQRWILWLLAWTSASILASGGLTKYIALSFPIAVWILASREPFRLYGVVLQQTRMLLAKGGVRVLRGQD
jgi:hypothetical protein